MAQQCGFFNAMLVEGEYDRVYLAEQFAAYFASFVGNGIFGKSMQQLQVKAQDTADMTTKVLSGEAWINGYWYRNTESLTLKHSMADGVLSRIDTIVLRWSNSERTMYLHILEGMPSYNPVAPALVRNADYYDLGLARVSIPAGAIRITQSQIQDLRLNNSYCGLVTGLIDQVDLTGVFNQFEQYFLEFKQGHENDFDTWSAAQKKNFDKWYGDSTKSWENQFEKWYDDNTSDWTEEIMSWFDTIKGQLDEDVAVNLQNQIYNINKILREVTEEEIDKMFNGSYEADDEGGSEPDIYSRMTDQEIDDMVNEAYDDIM